MKIVHSKSRGLESSPLLIALVITALVGFTLAAYLSLLGAENATTMRSQAWNASVPVVEAGCEDALAHLNAHGKTNLNCDGWLSQGSHFSRSNWCGEGFYNVIISNYPANPIISSFGYMKLPKLVSSEQQYPVFASISGTPFHDRRISADTYIVRGVRLTTRQTGLFVKAMIAKGKITMGNTV